MATVEWKRNPDPCCAFNSRLATYKGRTIDVNSLDRQGTEWGYSIDYNGYHARYESRESAQRAAIEAIDNDPVGLA